MLKTQAKPLKHLLKVPRGTPDFKCQGSSNGGKNQNPTKSIGLPTKPQKIPGPKIIPKIINVH